MRILLIEPAKAAVTLGGEDTSIYEPLALEYIAAGVSGEHKVKLLDMRLDKDLVGALNSFRPHVVGITAYTVHVNVVRGLCDQIKDWNAEVLTVVGGHHATVAPEDFLSFEIDLIVRGEGVRAFQEIVARFGRGEDLLGIPGVVVRANGRLISADYPRDVDLDELPFPDRSVTAEYRSRYFSEWMRPLASMRTSKGCPHKCSFCALWKVTGGRYLRRSPEKIVEELAGIEEAYVFFADDESLVDAARMKALARLIKEAGIEKRYFLYGRSDTIARHPDLLEAWKGIGLERVFVGLEFFRDEDLEWINKGSTIEDNDRAVQVLRDLDLEIYASFIVRPDFGPEDFTACRDYCRMLGLSFATFAVLTPLPGTDFYEEVKDQMITHNYDLFDFLHTVLPTKLPLDEFYEELHGLYMRAIPFRRQASILRHFSVDEATRSIMRFQRFLNRLRRAHQDY